MLLSGQCIVQRRTVKICTGGAAGDARFLFRIQGSTSQLLGGDNL